MYIYDFYYTIVESVQIFSENVDRVSLRVYSAMISAGLWAVLFLLMGFGLYQMAKRRHLRNKWMAFVPFLNIYYIGKLTGDCEVFGRKMKRAGMYAMIAEIAATVACFSLMAAELYLYIECGSPVNDEGAYISFWTGLQGTPKTVAKFYEIMSLISDIVILISSILFIILIVGLFKKYSVRNYFVLGIVALLIPGSHYVIIFILRKNKAIDYAAYVRAKREAYMRQQQQYYNQYGNPYNRNPYNQNPYNQNPYGGAYQNAPKDEDPFSEFPTDNTQNNGNGSSSSNKGKDPLDPDGFFD